MTTTTVEVEKTVTEEETLALCNECQREVDGNGREFVPRKGGTGSVDLHLCSECLSKMTDGGVQPEYVERAQDWLSTERQTEFKAGTVRGNVNAANNLLRRSVATGILLGVTLLLGTFLAPFAIPSWVFGLYGLGGLLATTFANNDVRVARKTIEQADREIN